MSDQWYYSRDGQRFGPLATEQLHQMAAARQLLPTDLLWKNGMPGWAPAPSVPGLFAADALDVQSTAKTAPRAAAADVLDHQSTARPIAEVPPRRPPSNDGLDGEVTAARRSAPPEPRPLADDLDRQATSRAAGGPPLVQARPAATADLKGQVIDNFLITRRLGEGGMGVVYKATDRDTDVEYAIKVLTPALCADPQALADLKKEVAHAQALTHQNLLKINYLATSGSLTYIVMECIDGESLEEYRLRKGRALPPEDFKKIAPQILSGLEFLHEKGVVHRDIKPQNIMIARNGDIKITDYGIALSIKEQLRRGSEVEAMGTLTYNAPEQMSGGDVVDRRADIYALGLMFHRLVSGQFPFNEKDKKAIVAWHKDENHRIANLGNPALNAVIQKAVSVNPAARFASCRDLLKELGQYGLIDRQDAEPAQPAVTGKGEQLLELTRLIRQQMQKRGTEMIQNRYPRVQKSEDGSYAMPPKSMFEPPGLVNPAEELGNELDVAQTRGVRMDPRVTQNVMALVQQAESILTKEKVPLVGWLAVAALAVGLLLFLIATATTSALAGFSGLFLMAAGLCGGLPVVWIPYFVKRHFCKDVLHYLRKEPEGPKFN